MQSNTTFATATTATTMGTRETILAELGGTSLKDLHKILAVVRLRNTAETGNNNKDISSHKDDYAEATPNSLEAPQNDPVATNTQDHVGIFA